MGIEGKLWTSDADWEMNPDGYAVTAEDALRRLSELNRIKNEARAPLMAFREALEKAGTGGEYAKAVYGFMEDIGLYGLIQKASERLLLEGENQLATEYEQLFGILVDALSQFYSVLKNEPLELSEFKELFSILLSGYDVGTIPVTLDAVTLGGAEAAEGAHFGAVFLLGASDGMFPPPFSQDGLLSDVDREELIALGYELASDPGSRAYEEDYFIYRMFSCARVRLCISYPLYMKGESKLRPARVVLRLQKLFPTLQTEYPPRGGPLFRLGSLRPALDLALSASAGRRDISSLSARRYFEGRPEYLDLMKLSSIAALQKRGPIAEKERIRLLYGDEIRMTASRAEKFESCRFSFFMQYGLRLKARKSASFDAPEIGTFLHYLLENGVKELCNLPGGIRTAGKESVSDVAQTYARQYAEEMLGGFANKSRTVFNTFSSGLLKALRQFYRMLRRAEMLAFCAARFRAYLLGARGYAPA